MKYLVAFIMLVITGCDSVGGIRHYANLEKMPSVECVEQALKSVSDVSNVTLTKEEGGRPLTIGGIKQPNKIYRFSYSVGELLGNFYFSLNYENKADYTHTYMYINATPPQSEIDVILPVIKQIESALFEKCGIHELNKGVDQYCTSGIKCI
ncbi:MAG: hypothetical protein U5M23_12905 [Marinagarivorans sp.]|nr:hypothetical protein [Marinagarivorans sp.]